MPYDYKTKLTVVVGGQTLIYFSQENADSILAQIKRHDVNPILVQDYYGSTVVLRPELCASIAVVAHERL